MGLTERTPYNISTLDAKDISMKSSPSGVMGLIQQEPGVNAAEMGHGIVKPFIRGLGFSRVVTVYQGNKLENHQWGADHGLGINDLGIASADIIKGPASILYGSGAIGGVILLNDDQPYLEDNKPKRTIGTTYNSVSAGQRIYASMGKSLSSGFYLAADGAYESHADYFDGDKRLIGNSRFNSQTLRIHSGYKTDDFHGKLSYTFNNQLLGIIEDDEMEEGQSLATTRGDREMQLPFQNVVDHLISYEQSYKVNDSWSTDGSISFHHNQREEIEDAFDEIDLGLQQKHIFYNLRATNKASGNLTNTFGFQGAYIDMRNMLEAEEILIPNAVHHENGFYYLGTYKSGDHTFQGGVRFDYRKLTADANQENIIEEGYTLPGEPTDRRLAVDFSGLTGSMGYTYKLNPKNLLKANISSGFRAPDLAELLSNGPHPGTNRFEVGNINFGREQSLQGDISWIRKGKNFSFEVSMFANYVNNYIFFQDGGDTTETGLNIWEFQQTDALLYGGEFALSFNPLESKRLTTAIHGNLIRGIDINANENLTFIPADRIGVGVKYFPFENIPLEVMGGYDLVFTQNRPGFNEVSTNGYNLVKASVKYTASFNNHKVAIGVTGFNLLNETYVDHISILRAFNVTHPGRNIMINIQWQF